MKKILSLILAILMIFSVVSLAGCGKAEALKLGFGVTSQLSEVKNADGENNGSAEAVTTVAAVLLDKDGKIVKCAIDTADNTMNFAADGKAVAATEFATKGEKGKDYGMVAYAGAKKEWFEQKDAFISVIIGKTIDEVKALEKDGKGTDEVVNAGCTIKVSEFIPAIEKAVKNAVDSAATADDTLKVGVVTSQSDAKDATAEAKGVNELMTTVVAVALNAKNEITAAKTDAVTTKVEFDTKGASETEFGTAISTKRDAGDNYGMVAYGGAKKEWFEQKDAFISVIIGKTIDEVKALEKDGKGT
ncbi:MAG: hypothetical protein IJ948_01060, partial [Clostridia bacterium]|nr:hypothetical protein [Clostridia bacterium]